MVHPVDCYVGQKLRNRRWMLGLTQNQLALIVGVRFQQIQKYENGINRISASRLWEISQALEVSVSYFYEGYTPDDTGQPDADKIVPEISVMESRETIELVRNYYAIDGQTRGRVLDLLKSLSEEEQEQVA